MSSPQSTSILPFSFETASVRVVMMDGIPMFSARDVAVAIGYANPAEAYTTHCKRLEKLSYSRLLELAWINPNRQGEYVIPESDVYRLAIKSNLPTSDRFETWVFEEVLPTIRKTGGYGVQQPQPALSVHLRRDVQIGYTKSANTVLMEQCGQQAIVQYAIKNCVLQSGKLPAEVRADGKAAGLKSKVCHSAKEVLRIQAPPVACGMSLADQMISGGGSQEDAISIGKDSHPLFAKMLACGITPPELLL